MVILIALVFAWWVRLDTSPPVAVTSSAVERGTFDPDQVIETDWFRFKAPKSWVFEQSLSKPDLYVYKDYVGTNPTGCCRCI